MNKDTGLLSSRDDDDDGTHGVTHSLVDFQWPRVEILHSPRVIILRALQRANTLPFEHVLRPDDDDDSVPI